MKVPKGYSTRLSLGLLLALLAPRFTTVCGDVLPNCPRHCECTNARSRSTRLPELGLGPLLKVKCGGREKSLSSFQELDLSSIMEDITQLDLSENQISVIENGAFSKLTQLKRLDLSRNQLNEVSSSIFDGLDKLERLKLNHNEMTHLKKGSFDNLTSLKQLDISGNPWFCDCELVWLLDWAHDRSVKLTSAAKCDAPAAMTGQPLRKLRAVSELDCAERATMPAVMELHPPHSQVVFEGDSLHLRCRSPAVGRETLGWFWEDRAAQDAFEDVRVTSQSANQTGVVESWLHIDHLLSDHTGLWKCHQASEHENRSLVIAVIVISEKTIYCPQEATSDSRGTYTWPKTVMGITAEILCEGEPPGGRKAYHSCTLEGHWTALNTSGCPFVSETTKILEQFAKMNLSLTKGTILESAKRLKNFTGDGKQLEDKMDIIFVAKTIENYLGFLGQEKELGSLLVDIVSSLLHVPAGVMRSAQEEGRACSRLVRAVEQVTENIPSLQAHGASIAAEEFRVRRDTFPGLTCTWYSHGGGGGRLFHCSNSNATALVGSKARVIEASVQVPASLFYQLEVQGVQGTALARQLTVAMYENAAIFPTMTSRDEEVTSAVVGVRLVGVPASGLADPVYVVLRAPTPGSTSPPRPVWWDGAGGWSSQGCQLSYLVDGLLVFQCNRLGYFGLIQKSDRSQDVSGSLFGLKFRFCHPAVYVGGLVAVATLSASVVVFVTCYHSIQMSNKTKHSLVNSWVALALLCVAYSVGIHQTEDPRVCRCVGLALHYLSLSVLLWMSVTAGGMYKRVARGSRPPHLRADDEDVPPPAPRKPLLGLYLVGWGVGLIVCGISGAVNLRQYAGRSHCFLGPGPAASAVFVPAAILVLYLAVCFLLVRCTVRSLDTHRQLSEGTQGTENVDLELLDHPAPERTSLHSASTPTASSVVEDPEYSSLTQLKAHVIVLALYVLAWTAGALATTTPFRDYFPYEEAIFSIIYAILASCLGSFVLFFYCVARSDVRKEWYLGHKPGRCCRTRSISDTNPVLPVPVANVAALGGATVVSSRHSVNNSVSHHTDKSSKTNKSVNAAKAAIELNHRAMKTDSPFEQKTNVNLVVLHRQQYKSNNSVTTFTEPSGMSSAEMFYNPHQSTVARKFFRKQRRHTRQNNLGTRRRGDGGGGDTDSNRPRSAVDMRRDYTLRSNTHEGVHGKTPHADRNSGDVSGMDLPLERLVIGAEEVDLFTPNPVARDNKSESGDLNITFEGEAELAELAAEFHAIKEEMKETRRKEASVNCVLEADPDVSSAEENILNGSALDVRNVYTNGIEKGENSQSDERNSVTATPEMCSLLSNDESRFVSQGVDSDSLASLNPVEGVDIDISLSQTNRKHGCSSYSTNSSQFTSSALELESEERECLTSGNEPSSNDDVVDDEQAAIVSKKETSV